MILIPSILKKATGVIFTLLFCVLMLSSPLFSLDSVILEDEKGSYLIGKHLEYLKDPSRELTIEDVNFGEYKDNFTKSNVDVPSFGGTSSNFWFRFSLKNNEKDTVWLFEFDYIPTGYIELYASDESGRVGSEPVWVSGLYVPYSERIFKGRTFVHLLKIPPSQTKTYYLKVKDINGADFPIKIYNTKSYYKKEIIANLFLGVFLGILFIMAVYHIFIVFMTRDISYIFYILFIICVMFYTSYLYGLFHQFIITGTIFPKVLTLTIFLPITSFSHIFTLLFTKFFLL